MSDLTRLLDAAAADLLPLVYNEVRQFAAARMAAGAPGEGVAGRLEIREKDRIRVFQQSLGVVSLL